MPAPGSSTRPPATITSKYLPLPAIVVFLRFPPFPNVPGATPDSVITIARRAQLREDEAYRHLPRPSKIVLCGCPSLLLLSPCCPPPRTASPRATVGCSSPSGTDFGPWYFATATR